MADLDAAIRAAEEALRFYPPPFTGEEPTVLDLHPRALRALLDAAKNAAEIKRLALVHAETCPYFGNGFAQAKEPAPAPLPPGVAEAAERLRRYAAEANCEMGDVETAESFAVRCAVRDLLAALDTPAPLLAASRNALTVLTEIAESAAYWSDYDVPVGLVPRVDEARARLAAALEGGAR